MMCTNFAVVITSIGEPPTRQPAVKAATRWLVDRIGRQRTWCRLSSAVVGGVGGRSRAFVMKMLLCLRGGIQNYAEITRKIGQLALALVQLAILALFHTRYDRNPSENEQIYSTCKNLSDKFVRHHITIITRDNVTKGTGMSRSRLRLRDRDVTKLYIICRLHY